MGVGEESMEARCARYKAERDCARQDAARLRKSVRRIADAFGIVPGDDAAWCADGMARAAERLSARLMPEGMEWPRFEDGDPVRIGDVVSGVTVRSVVLREDGIILSDCTSVPGWGTWRSYKEPIKRPEKVLDADGVEIRVGDKVWTDYGDGPWTVTKITTTHAWHVYGESDELGSLDMPPSTLTHRAPVLAADGKPLREGETVYEIETGERYFVTRLFSGVTEPDFPDHTVECCRFDDVVTHMFKTSQLTHERPVNHCFECSHWQVEPGRDRLGVCWDTYGERECEDSYAAVLGTSEACAQFERRAKALAERGQ